MSSRRTIILAPLDAERRAIARALRRAPAHRPTEGREASVELRLVGPRAARLSQATGLRDADLVIVAGMGGALDPQFGPGDVVLDAPPPGFGGDERCYEGLIHTSETLVATPEEKREIRRATGCAVVDMELAIVRDCLAGTRVPVCGVRAILDGADESLPPLLGDLVDDAGRPRHIAVLGAIARREISVIELTRLSRRSGEVTRRLGSVVRRMVEADGAGDGLGANDAPSAGRREATCQSS